jgi:Rha family phage regulatory protein
MTELTIIKKDSGAYIDSREVADLIGKQHKNLLRDIGTYIAYMENSIKLNFELNDFFIESSYVDSIGRTLPCYLLSKMGCEMLANKLTGEKGVLFTAAYVAKFNEMETAERAEQENLGAMPAPRLGEYNACARIVVRALRNIGATAEQIVMFLKGVYEPLGIIVTIEAEIEAEPQMYTARQIAEMFGVYSLTGNPHAQAVSCILNENLFIGDSHKSVVSMNYGDHIGVSVRYDEYAARSVKEWLVEYGLPSEVYGFERTYTIRYAQ